MTTKYRSPQIQSVPPADPNGQSAKTAKLRKDILGQWQAETLRRLSDYPLPVPFSEMRFGQLPGREVATMQDWSVILHGKQNTEPPNLNDTFENIAETFKHANMPRRLVVLGDAGSGKTVTAQALTVLLLGGTIVGETNESAAAADTGGEMLVPVLLQLSKWDPDPHVTLERWVETQMLREIPATRVIVDVNRDGEKITWARQLIEEKQVLMVLDGLDEVKEENRQEVYKELAGAATEDRPMVITCRTREFVKMVDKAHKPLPKTPVIRLDPLDLDDVIDYLKKADQTLMDRFAPLTAELAARPLGELAKALSSPFRLWLVKVVYETDLRDPAELLAQDTVNDIERILLSGLVEGVYSAKVGERGRVRDEAEIETVRGRLAKIAQYLGSDTDSQDIDWWVLPNQPPRWYIGSVIGGVVGLLLGAASGYAAAVKFTPRIGVILGLSMMVATGILAGVTACRGQEYPRTVDIKSRGSFKRFLGCVAVSIAVGATAGYADAVRGGWIAALVTAAIIGPAAAIPCREAFGKPQGNTAGVTAALALGLASGLSLGNHHAVLSGVIAGAAFIPSAWVFVGIFQPSTENFHINPDSLLDRDRQGSQVVAVTAGLAFAVIFGIALGPVVGAIAFVGLTVAIALTVSMWGAFNVSRIWFAADGMFPMSIMGFLREAYERGVLRQAGGTYQFRHAKLKYALGDMEVAAEAPLDTAEHQVSNIDLD